MCLAIPGQILESAGGNLAVVDVLGVRRKVDLALLEDRPQAGEWVRCSHLEHQEQEKEGTHGIRTR